MTFTQKQLKECLACLAFLAYCRFMTETKTYLEKINQLVRHMSAPELWQIFKKKEKITIIDIRERAEIQNQTLPQACTLGRGFLEFKIKELCPEVSQKIIVYCAGGNRSALAVKSLQDMGYQNVFSLQGGFNAWKNANLPLQKKRILNDDEFAQFSRHINLLPIGETGQVKLLESRVLILGLGGLGCPAAQYLAAAGVGTMGLVDFDVVEKSNLQRQILYREKFLGFPKVDVAKHELSHLNPHIRIKTHEEKFCEANASFVLQNYDIVINGCDNFKTRYLVNEMCVRLGKILVDASVQEFAGQVTVLATSGGPCYRCLYPEAPPALLAPNCAELGVMGAVPGILGTLQAIEAIKIILKIGEPLVGKLLRYNALTQEFQKFNIKKDPHCKTCGDTVKKRAC